MDSSQSIQGDADCSGDVTTGDAMAILLDAASLEDAPCEFAANANCFGGITAADALLVIRHLAGSPAPAGVCIAVADPLGVATTGIDPGLEPGQDSLPGLSGGPPRPVASSIGPDGVQVDYVANEVVIKPGSAEALQAFLDEYNGTVLRDGTTSGAAGVAGGPGPVNERYHLVQVDPFTSPAADLPQNLEDAGLAGHVTFSSLEGERLAAIAMREAGNGVTVNIVGEATVSNEVPLNADHTVWMDFEKDAAIADSETLSIGVDRAWAYLKYHLLPPDNGTFDPVRVGVVDSGFALNSAGVPLDSNIDYWYLGSKPTQYDMVDEDPFAGGAADFECSGKPCPWHGQSAFGVCCARPHNNYGIAGTGGDVVMPILVKTDNSMYTLASSIRKAYGLGATVISVSVSGNCGFWCDVSTADGELEDAVNDITSFGAVIVSGAGNNNVDISDEEFLPCQLGNVICVGGISFAKTNVYNWGDGVDIWAPYQVWTTGNPDRVAKDDNDWGEDELQLFDGTSASAPFVTGIVAMMRALDPSLSTATIRQILQQTANESSDPKVAHGYVDALRAVMAVRENAQPTIQITLPFQDSTRSYKNAIFRAIVTDPDPGAGLDRFAGQTTVGFYGQAGLICQTNSIVYHGIQPTYECIADVEPGTKQIEAVVTDPFGGTDSTEIGVLFTSGPPDVILLKPLNNATYYANQLIKFDASVIDPDESPFPPEQIVWTSNIDGELIIDFAGIFLSQGTHTITVKATDELGLSDEQSITVNVLSGAGIPNVIITQPAHGSVQAGAPAMTTFSGSATDTEDGSLTGNSLVWTSSVHGVLGSGETIQAALAGGNCDGYIQHVIRLTATDSDNHVVYAEITISVGPIC
ncbi:MAG: S8 family serine peptidase [Dehalococcoidia bacterium]